MSHQVESATKAATASSGVAAADAARYVAAYLQWPSVADWERHFAAAPSLGWSPVDAQLGALYMARVPRLDRLRLLTQPAALAALMFAMHVARKYVDLKITFKAVQEVNGKWAVQY